MAGEPRRGEGAEQGGDGVPCPQRTAQAAARRVADASPCARSGGRGAVPAERPAVRSTRRAATGVRRGGLPAGAAGGCRWVADAARSAARARRGDPSTRRGARPGGRWTRREARPGGRSTRPTGGPWARRAVQAPLDGRWARRRRVPARHGGRWARRARVRPGGRSARRAARVRPDGRWVRQVLRGRRGGPWVHRAARRVRPGDRWPRWEARRGGRWPRAGRRGVRSGRRRGGRSARPGARPDVPREAGVRRGDRCRRVARVVRRRSTAREAAGGPGAAGALPGGRWGEEAADQRERAGGCWCGCAAPPGPTRSDRHRLLRGVDGLMPALPRVPRRLVNRGRHGGARRAPGLPSGKSTTGLSSQVDDGEDTVVAHRRVSPVDSTDDSDS